MSPTKLRRPGGKAEGAAVSSFAEAERAHHNTTAAGNKGAHTAWTTRLEPELTRPHGVEELHNVCFEPDGWPGHGTCVTLLIPECELQVAAPAANGEPVTMINRPQHNRKVKAWLRTACEIATAERAFFTISCDTAEQAAHAAKRAGRLLPRHRRAALERMYDPAPRARGGLS